MSEVTKEQVEKYVWPHIDYGKSQVPCTQPYDHGDIIEIKYPDDTIKKGAFRVLESGLYDKDWYTAALPLAKEVWAERRDTNYYQTLHYQRVFVRMRKEGKTIYMQSRADRVVRDLYERIDDGWEVVTDTQHGGNNE